MLAIVNTVVSVFYYARFLAPMYFADEEAPSALLGRWATAATVASGFTVVAIGLAAEPFTAAFSRAMLLPGG